MVGNHQRLFDPIFCQTRWRDLLICLAALAILATIALPSLLLKHPDNTSEESTTVKGGPRSDDLKMEKGAGRFTTYQDLLVKEPVHPVEGADPEFWRANGRQWVADQARNLLIIASLLFFSL